MMAQAFCPTCKKGFKSEGHLKQHAQFGKCGGVVPTTVPVKAPALAPAQAWPEYKPPVRAAPTVPAGVPSQGVLITSGLWKTAAAVENAFLPTQRVVVTAEQEAQMDQNLMACAGKPGMQVSPWAGLISGIFMIFIVPILLEFAPLVKAWVMEQLDKHKKKAEAKKAEVEHGRSELPTAGPKPGG